MDDVGFVFRRCALCVRIRHRRGGQNESTQFLWSCCGSSRDSHIDKSIRAIAAVHTRARRERVSGMVSAGILSRSRGQYRSRCGWQCQHTRAIRGRKTRRFCTSPHTRMQPLSIVRKPADARSAGPATSGVGAVAWIYVRLSICSASRPRRCPLGGSGFKRQSLGLSAKGRRQPSTVQVRS